jgi:hypothetical protein
LNDVDFFTKKSKSKNLAHGPLMLYPNYWPCHFQFDDQRAACNLIPSRVFWGLPIRFSGIRNRFGLHSLGNPRTYSPLPKFGGTEGFFTFFVFPPKSKIKKVKLYISISHHLVVIRGISAPNCAHSLTPYSFTIHSQMQCRSSSVSAGGLRSGSAPI